MCLIVGGSMRAPGAPRTLAIPGWDWIAEVPLLAGPGPLDGSRVAPKGRPKTVAGLLRGKIVERLTVATLPLDPWMSLKALSAYSGLSVRQLQRAIAWPAEKALPAYRIEGRVLVRRSDYDTWAERFRHVGRPALVQALRELGLEQTGRAYLKA